MLFNKNNMGEIIDTLIYSSVLELDETNRIELSFELAFLLESANKYGCEMSQSVCDGWGNSVTVTAVPDTIRHTWSF